MKNRFLKLISSLLALVLLVNMLPLQIFAEEYQRNLTAEQTEESTVTPDATTDALPEETAPEDAYVVAEITENRTEYSKEFLMSNGLHMAAVYADPVHYETENGWEEIDNTLKTNTDGSYSNTAGIWDVTFPEQLGADKSVTIEKDGYTLSFSMSGELQTGNGQLTTQPMQIGTASQPFAVATAQTVTGVIQQKDTSAIEQAPHPEAVPDKLQSQIAYAEVYENTDIIYDLDSNTVKESMILERYDPNLQGYSYTLEVGAMIPVLEEDGSVTFYDEKREDIVMVMPAPYLIDDNGEHNYDIEVQLAGKGSTYILAYLLPTEWLAETDRVWPVVLDPLVQGNTAATNIQDRTVAQNTTYAQNGSILEVGYTQVSGIHRAYIKYDTLPAITSADVVVYATMSLCKLETSDVEVIVEAHKVTENWTSAGITWADQPDWDAEVEDYLPVKAAGYYHWEITDLVRDWYAAANNGMLFKANATAEGATTNNYKQFGSSDLGTTGTKPVLSVFFRNNNGLESYWDYTASSAGRAGTGYVNNYTGNLVWVREDMGFGGNRMPVSISHVYNLNDAIVSEDENNSNDSSGNRFGMGYGWRTNYNQLVYRWNVNDAYYIWEDADGTDHYFKDDETNTNTYKDEDGLELTLTTNGTGNQKYCITDKNGNCSYFDTQGRLSQLVNNQATKSSITISYRNSTSLLIETITDGVGRVYDYVYSNDFLSKIQYLGTGTEVLHEMVFVYTSSCLTKVRDYDGKDSDYTYSGKLLTSASDIDDYLLTYTYTQGAGNTWQPYRVQSVEESDKNASGNTVQGGKLTFAYAHNQTTITDTVRNQKNIYQFNDFGNTVSIQDDQGRAQFTQFARTKKDDTEGKANQLKLSSKLQNTVANRMKYSSFENGETWGVWPAGTSCQNVTTGYMGSRSLLFTATEWSCLTSEIFTIEAGATYTFSAYVKGVSGASILSIVNRNTVDGPQVVATSGATEWKRVEISYTNTGTAAIPACAQVFGTTGTQVYIDCVQVEKSASASRYNLIENGDFRHNTAWLRGSNLQSTETYVTDTAAAPVLDNRVYKIVGSPTLGKHLYQQVKVSGEAGDTYVLAGWAKGDSVPLTESTGRRFALVAYFQNTDGSVTERMLSFNPDCPGTWQYAAIPVIAEQDYSAINIDIQYDYNANTAYFDGIQLYKEEFGNSYTYYDDGNVKSVKDLQAKETTYEYSNNNLTTIIENNKAVMQYSYDDHHNVRTAKTTEDVLYTFTYDNWGNNTSVSVGSGTNKITAFATYTDDKNYLATTTDALGNVTTYDYNQNTGVLEMVIYPENNDIMYGYDSLFRRTVALSLTDISNPTMARYTYTDDLLTRIQTNTTTYNFTYGVFDLRTGVSVGNQSLASYTYSDDRRYNLERLDYGNGDSVQYEYDDEERLIKQTYEDGAYVTYTYDNSGELVKVYDSQSGITTAYTYDLSGRTVKVTESGTNHSLTVTYTYDAENNISQQVETVNGTTHTYEYTYDEDNRIIGQTVDDVETIVTYDEDYGRTTGRTVKVGNTTVTQDTYAFTTNGNATSGQVETHTQVYAGYTIPYTYTYDDNGNIVEIDDGLYKKSYVYDKANQLIRENNQLGGYTHTWSYDNSGNILTRTEYAYTTGSLEGVTPTDTVNYTYGNSNWGDLLTAYDGQALTYDNIGNLLSDGEWTYTWKHGRQLATASRNGVTWNYTYDANGMRTKKDCGILTFTYVYDGSQLAEMTFYNDLFKFTYDAGGAPLTVDYNGTVYYYVTNLQGDVTEIRNANRQVVVTYRYDAWGKVLSVTGSMASTLGQSNPLRYRGYVYDQETCLYYLQSRYYDPEWGRFINADAYAATGEGFVGNNMFAYCNNNPAVLSDTTGTLPAYCVLMTDTGYNAQARAYAANKQLENLSDHEKNFSKPAVLESYSEGPNGFSHDVAYSGSHSVLEAEDITLSTDVFIAEAGVSAGFVNNSLSAGVYLLKSTIAYEVFDEFSIEIGFTFGVGGEFQAGANGFKLGGSLGPGFLIAVSWDEESYCTYY